MADIVQLIVLLNGLLGQFQIQNVTQFTDFGLQLLQTQNHLNSNQNVLLSPPSVAMALAMLSSGSEGNTKQQLTARFPFLTEIKANRLREISTLFNESLTVSTSTSTMATDFLDRRRRSNDVNSDSDSFLEESYEENSTAVNNLSKENASDTEEANGEQGNLVNAIKYDLTKKTSKVWLINKLLVDTDLQLNNTFVQTLKNDFESDVFISNSTEWNDKLKQINDWSAKNTNNLIRELVPPNLQFRRHNVHILSGLAFDAVWSRPFSKQNTRKLDFDNFSGNKLKVDFMKNEDRYPYAEFPTHQLISLSYEQPDLPSTATSDYRFQFDSSLRLLIFLPNPNATLDSVVKSIASGKQFQEQIDQLKSHRINILMPKFKIEKSIDIRDTLKSMNLTAPFETSSDYARMCADQEIASSSSSSNSTLNETTASELKSNKVNSCSLLEIDEMVHAVSLSIDEEGTKAAATTRISMSPRALFHSIDFFVQRPFAFVLAIDQVPLFVGVLRDLDPSKN